jgi:hypothetical protein
MLDPSRFNRVTLCKGDRGRIVHWIYFLLVILFLLRSVCFGFLANTLYPNSYLPADTPVYVLVY